VSWPSALFLLSSNRLFPDFHKPTRFCVAPPPSDSAAPSFRSFTDLILHCYNYLLMKRYKKRQILHRPAASVCTDIPINNLPFYLGGFRALPRYLPLQCYLSLPHHLLGRNGILQSFSLRSNLSQRLVSYHTESLAITI